MHSPTRAATCSLANQLLLGACRRHNAVHPQVLHHLTIVIIPVGRCKSGNRNPRAESVDRLDGDKCIFCRDGRNRLVRIDERCFQCSHRFVLRRNGADCLQVAVRLNAAPAEKEVVRLRQVRHLCHKGAHGIELRRLARSKDALRRRETVLIGWHSLRRAHYLELHHGEQTVHRFRGVFLCTHRRRRRGPAHLRPHLHTTAHHHSTCKNQSTNTHCLSSIQVRLKCDPSLDLPWRHSQAVKEGSYCIAVLRPLGQEIDLNGRWAFCPVSNNICCQSPDAGFNSI